jgi:hypothetical protein
LRRLVRPRRYRLAKTFLVGLVLCLVSARLLQVGAHGLETGERVHWNIGAGSSGPVTGAQALFGSALFLAGGVVSLYFSWRAWRKS